jgi:hypothetical protein
MSELRNILKDDERELKIYPHDGRWRAVVTIYGHNAQNDRNEMATASTPEEAVRELGIKLTGLCL